MKQKISFALIIFLHSSLYLSAQIKDYQFQPLPFTSVKLTDNFWLPRLKINHTTTIPASFERCVSTGRVKNFTMAAARKGKFCTTFPFDDTDIYKTIEGASFSLSLFPDKKLESYVDSLILIIAAAQEDDGYLYTARTIDPLNPHAWAGAERWMKERELSHELYNSGHLYEAAAAHFTATGKKNLLNIAIKNANLVCSIFGENKKHMAPGHQVIEMGLVKLYRLTGNKEYLETAKYFIEERGHYNGYDAKNKDPWKNGAYWQDHIPVKEQKEAIGHAVRAGYLYGAMADVAALTGDELMLQAIDTIWQNLVEKKLYVQGGAGAIGSGERYGDNYELPNATAYNETCAAIANVYWNQRMFQLHGDAKYIDVLEKILYNGLISGVSLDGKSFFYTNAMQVVGKGATQAGNGFTNGEVEVARSGWFNCSCCPTNVCRFLPSLPGYMYAQKDDQVFVNLFASSAASLNINNKKISITQKNNYPWDGQLAFKIDPQSAQQFSLLIRIPGWAQAQAMPTNLYHFKDTSTEKILITINGEKISYTLEKGYAVLRRTWKKNDVVEVNLRMPVQRVYAHEKLNENLGKVALQRGPLLYCAEWVDNDGKVANMLLPKTADIKTEHRVEMLNGVTVLSANAIAIHADETKVSSGQQTFTAIPYYAWANRGKGEMLIWFPERISQLQIISH